MERGLLESPRWDVALSDGLVPPLRVMAIGLSKEFTTDMYIELHARSAFSFLAGASLPEELVAACVSRGMPALALLDRDNVSGIVRFHKEAVNRGVNSYIGAEITLEDGSKLPLLAESRQGYQNLCRLISRIKLRAPKGLGAAKNDDLAIILPALFVSRVMSMGLLQKLCRRSGQARARLDELTCIYGRQNVFVELQRHFDRLERPAIRRQLLWRKASSCQSSLQMASAMRLQIHANCSMSDVCHIRYGFVKRVGYWRETQSDL